MSRRVMVTGGAGFIGSAVVRLIIAETDWQVLNVDKLTYAGNLESLAEVTSEPRYRFAQKDICDRQAMAQLFAELAPDLVIHLAAESHVDRSIDVPAHFVATNVVGTFALLEAALAHWEALAEPHKGRFRFLHVSTDEVFGSLGETGSFTEETPYRPNSPYSATKAASDHLARAWHRTYGLPVLTSNCSNNYGPCQFPEKLIPLMVLNALEGKPLPVYGDGGHIRDWLYVDDHARGLLAVAERGTPGETYNIGGAAERANIDVVRSICAIMDEAFPDSPHAPHDSLITFVPDRPGHDLRYAMNTNRIERELGWRPRESFDTGLRKTVLWYRDNPAWWQHIRTGSYRGARLGLRAS